jgi:hypothetical protein
VQALGQAAPRPILGPADETRLDGVAFNKAGNAHEVMRRRERPDVELGSGHGNRTALTAAVAHVAGLGYPSQQRPERRGVFDTQNQMPMVWQEAERHQPRRISRQR